MYHDFKGIANRATMWHISGMPFTGMPFTLKPQEDAPWRGLDYESLAITKQYSLPPPFIHKLFVIIQVSLVVELYFCILSL